MNPTIFREYDIRGVYPATLDAAAAEAVGRAFGSVVAEASGPGTLVVVGHDGRQSSPVLRDALISGLVQSGCQVQHLPCGPTPELYFAGYTLGAAGAVMVTGSHNPPDHNGFKFMLGKKPFFGEQIRALYTRIQEARFTAGEGSAAPCVVREAYLAALVEAYGPARGLKLVWDAGNGAAGEVMAALTARLPGTHTLLNAAIDGTFPAHHPDPTVPENLEQLIHAVRAAGADAGIAFDGDGDRVGVVDDTGAIVWGDQFLALMAEDVLATRPGATIIADVKSSQVCFDEIARLGGRALMWKTGHSHIKAKMAETGAPLAGEMSGHVFFADRYFGFDDGLYAAVRFAAWLARQSAPLSVVRQRLPQRMSTPEIRFACDELRKFEVVEEVAARLRARGATFSDVDGVRVTTPEGWWLLRASNTQALLVARCESPHAEGLKTLESELRVELEKSGVVI